MALKISFPSVYNLKTAVLLQVLFSMIALACAFLNLRAMRLEEEDRLHSEAARIAARAAQILSASTFYDDYLSAKQIIAAEMEDSRVSAIAVFKNDSLLEGQRRDSNWETVPWDDLLPEDAVEGVKSLTMEDREIGRVVVYLSARFEDESLGLALRREIWRFMALFAGAALLQLAALGKWRAAQAAPQPPEQAAIAAEDLAPEAPLDVPEPARAAHETPQPPEQAAIAAEDLAPEAPLRVPEPQCAAHETPQPPEQAAIAAEDLAPEAPLDVPEPERVAHETPQPPEQAAEPEAETPASPAARACGRIRANTPEKFFQACQYAPLNLIILAADGDFAALGELAGELSVYSLDIGREDLHNDLNMLKDAALNNHGAVARLAENSALELSKVLRAMDGGR